MSRRVLRIVLVALALVALLSSVALADTATTKRIGLVIGFPDGSTHLEIVTVAGAATMHDVLAAADITLTSVDSGYGPAVCGIDGVGCPATNCFCDPAKYWAYYHLNAATKQWVSAATGVGGYTPADGEVEGLAWSGFDASYNPTVQPPVYTFAEIVAATTPAAEVPEPGTLLLLGSGLSGVLAYVRLRRSR